jgi:hypothetical protein
MIPQRPQHGIPPLHPSPSCSNQWRLQWLDPA